VRRGADGSEHVLDERQVEHLLLGDLEDRLPPAADRPVLLGRQAFVAGPLQREGRVEVLAHDPVLELGGLAQEIDERIAVLDHDGRLRGRERGRSCAGATVHQNGFRTMSPTMRRSPPSPTAVRGQGSH
jgi:hypothetical protein